MFEIIHHFQRLHYVKIGQYDSKSWNCNYGIVEIGLRKMSQHAAV